MYKLCYSFCTFTHADKKSTRMQDNTNLELEKLRYEDTNKTP